MCTAPGAMRGTARTRPIRSDHCGEVTERPDDLPPTVRLPILDLKPMQAAAAADHRLRAYELAEAIAAYPRAIPAVPKCARPTWCRRPTHFWPAVLDEICIDSDAARRGCSRLIHVVRPAGRRGAGEGPVERLLGVK